MTKQYRNNAQHAGSTLWFAARASAFAALCAFGMQPLVASAQATLPITVDTGAAVRPSLGTSGNGTQVVNIVAANAAGVSNNRFAQYNVGTGGVILNNATKAAQTQTGGAVQANAALGGRSANLVLMQVTGGQASQLLGTTEVAGQGANVVLANPAGITCSGCGFLNAPRVTLATGTPTLNADGSLGAIDVKQGTISVAGNGLNGSSSAVDLIARAITVNAQVRGKSIDAMAGANRVDYASKTATAQAGTGAKPEVAIDVQSLGSMYGDGAVRMVGTEAGVGVRDNGALTSLTGNLSIASNGDVTIGSPARVKAGDSVNISGANVRNDGAISAQGVGINAQSSLTSAGSVEGTREAMLGGNQLTLSGGSVKGGAVTLQGANVSNQGATVSAARQLNVTGNRVNNAGTLNSTGDMRINVSDTFSNAKGTVLAQNSVLFSGGTLDNSNGKIAATTGTVAAQTARVVNANGTMRAGDMLSIDAQNVDNTKGTLASAGNATIGAGSGLNNTDGVIDVAKSASVRTSGTLLNTRGSLKAGDLAALEARSLDNRNGTLSTTRGSAQINAQEILNGNGHITTADRLSVNASSLDNTAGTIAMQGPSTIDVNGKLVNDRGSIVSKTFVTGTVGSLSNAGGTISGDIRVRSGNGNIVPPVPQPDANPSAFDPGPGYLRVAMKDYDPNKYQSGFFGPDGYFYAKVGTTLQAMR
ncbi:filamentous hemagglutinin N-terminal domain-containing protein [Paraburkholderia unamae]|uniref:Filamentous hemagglutinin n=1 Tax=Paraburkholderia unamae TaxID=219649 RepID=A0ABX5KC81_9BURK|nr:filamentous hemagglutinin N-terminal domain-containing protein [Paraburkholderia unamae]PVX70810.1 filamentous hemagglutinin [Paraburkholderia unamae]CAG9246678.1 Filamentous hemagglutinin outer membrane protein [Paraburkholderia unamae]